MGKNMCCHCSGYSIAAAACTAADSADRSAAVMTTRRSFSSACGHPRAQALLTRCDRGRGAQPNLLQKPAFAHKINNRLPKASGWQTYVPPTGSSRLEWECATSAARRTRQRCESRCHGQLAPAVAAARARPAGAEAPTACLCHALTRGQVTVKGQRHMLRAGVNRMARTRRGYRLSTERAQQHRDAAVIAHGGVVVRQLGGQWLELLEHRREHRKPGLRRQQADDLKRTGRGVGCVELGTVLRGLATEI